MKKRFLYKRNDEIWADERIRVKEYYGKVINIPRDLWIAERMMPNSISCKVAVSTYKSLYGLKLFMPRQVKRKFGLFEKIESKQIGRPLRRLSIHPHHFNAINIQMLALSKSMNDCVCWIYYNDSAHPIRSSLGICKYISKKTTGGYIKLGPQKRFFVDCLLKTAPYGLYEQTPKEWFIPENKIGDYHTPIYSEDELCRCDVIDISVMMDGSDIKYFASLFTPPLDVVNESPDGE